ncbi:hypothetical protein FK529_06090 [Tsukamurella asaccharolytica]|uniref:Uncharacterized protein n=1 Tax=Tsukamurella asaccharolytica TaxID=2592067 RepID=A0A5C5REQ0_9ACTN|nr:hypothetical protein [Tsukamurella asaccharolytica]TWS20883.1 hypothetical protein FK529_06090 [Tsukamurella asaccharolytica]
MPEDCYISLAHGAYQVYDSRSAAQMSVLVGSMLKEHLPNAYCFAGDWRGVQFLLESQGAARDRGSAVYIFDPSRMVLDEITTYGKVLDAQENESIANGADPEALRDWLQSHGLGELPNFTCVGTDRFYFMQNSQLNAETPRLDDEPIAMISFVGAAGKVYLGMQ